MVQTNGVHTLALDTKFIRCVDGREPQIHELWCLRLENVTREIHLIVLLEFSAGTMGEFTTNNLAENGRIIPIIRQLSINISVQFWGISNFGRRIGLSFIENLQAPIITTGWVHANTYNQNWLVIPEVTYSNSAVTWGSTVPVCQAYMPGSPVNPRASRRRVRDNFLCCRRREQIRGPTTSCNPIVNPRIHRHGDNQEGPGTQ